MSASIVFSVMGKPVPKARARVTRSGHAYTPAKTKDYERLVQDVAIIEMKKLVDADPDYNLYSGPLVMMLAVYMPVPKSWSKSKTEMALAGAIAPTSKPDLDNVVKSVSDALNKICYVDDSQIVDLIVSKRYSLYPRVDVVISCLGGGCV
jgi:Holliday junction resolvase RusA-like endonuclease